MEIQRAIYLLLMLATAGDSYNILVLVTTPSPSLFNLFEPIIKELNFMRQEITVQSFYALKKPLPNVHEMKLKTPDYGEDEALAAEYFLQSVKSGPLVEFYETVSFYTTVCESYLQDESTKSLLSAGKQFDLVLADGIADCGLVVATLLGKHVVNLLGCENFPWLYSDIPAPPSYVPNIFRRMPSEMTFWERTKNAIDIVGFRVINDYVLIPTEEKLLAKYLPGAPSIEDARNRVALTLTNGDPVMSSPRPSMPNVIHCGGLHCTRAKPLPKELNDFVESSGDDGFIMFGLGTNMKSTYLPVKTRDAILETFSRLKQKVIWKYEANLENIPENVKITKWMPQQDLLAHPKVRLFITHAGLLSMQEAIYHAVPVIGIPFFVDQPGNIGRIQAIGVGEYLDFTNITVDGFYELINKVLTDESYRSNAEKYSAIFRFQPDSPLDRAIFWVMYVLRHDGATHLHPASRHLNIFQYFLIDVIGFIILVAVVAVGITSFTVKLILRKLFVKKPSRSSTEKKRQ